MPQCPVCQSEVDADFGFCPNCGARLATLAASATPPESAPPGLEEQPKLSRAKIAATIVIIVLLVAVSVLAVTPFVSPTRSVVVPATCPSNSAASTFVAAPAPNYDFQEVMAFTQTYSQLEFNVTAIAQCDANGYGPAYLLNGLTNTGYWYQVGINWDWPLTAGGYSPGFQFVSEAWAPGGLTRSPPSVAFSGTVNQGDTIELGLTFSGGEVVASALDLNTGASGSTSYPSREATEFIGSQEQQSQRGFLFATEGYFTGLMTEWYHVNSAYSGSGQGVTYSENITAIASATIGIGEWNFTTLIPTSVFSDVANGGNPVDLTSQPNQLQQFVLNGFTVSADAFEFVTGA